MGQIFFWRESLDRKLLKKMLILPVHRSIYNAYTKPTDIFLNVHVDHCILSFPNLSV